MRTCSPNGSSTPLSLRCVECILKSPIAISGNFVSCVRRCSCLSLAMLVWSSSKPWVRYTEAIITFGLSLHLSSCIIWAAKQRGKLVTSAIFFSISSSMSTAVELDLVERISPACFLPCSKSVAGLRYGLCPIVLKKDVTGLGSCFLTSCMAKPNTLLWLCLRKFLVVSPSELQLICTKYSRDWFFAFSMVLWSSFRACCFLCLFLIFWENLG